MVRISLGKDTLNQVEDSVIQPPLAGPAKDKPSEQSQDDKSSQQVVEQSEEENGQNLIEIASNEEANQLSIERVVENHESIIIPAI